MGSRLPPPGFAVVASAPVTKPGGHRRAVFVVAGAVPEEPG